MKGDAKRILLVEAVGASIKSAMATEAREMRLSLRWRWLRRVGSRRSLPPKLPPASFSSGIQNALHTSFAE